MGKLSAQHGGLSDGTIRYKQGKREAIMRRPKLVVTVAFEPGRVGVHAMIDAYAQLVPIHKRCSKGVVAVDDKLKQVTWSYRRANR